MIFLNTTQQRIGYALLKGRMIVNYELERACMGAVLVYLKILSQNLPGKNLISGFLDTNQSNQTKKLSNTMQE
jgi:hypothetical protein